ncbi:hypothetical protein MYCTH_2301658 [Thermothelomyces thermophilus ATCC 42464]|uniref:Uncharacterized protein n=1 Tax=Thermothelomyces thermophilus (strain ATCC 42464 / BCRC 31852 / DSM 1799) TaxID=573729 RepID=G2Q9V4_THET4|nr:uncharacterized protein MYCTH_2301658 [Thermothelomyces thermophilus ATCC 42464]AEO56563.1 hypothetical protein MYCTH_2301658 [Thermothelomyces thermophilus ATCC 42464]
MPEIPSLLCSFMPHPLALFSLKRLNQRASQAVAHPCNAHLVSISKDKVPVLDVGHVRSATGDDATLATLAAATFLLTAAASPEPNAPSRSTERPTSHCSTTSLTARPIWFLFVTILWMLDVGGIRGLGFPAYEDVRRTVLSIRRQYPRALTGPCAAERTPESVKSCWKLSDAAGLCTISTGRSGGERFSATWRISRGLAFPRKLGAT